MTPSPAPKFDPKVYYSDPPSANTPTIGILSPQNSTYKAGTLNFTCYVRSNSWAINGVFYRADWLEGTHRIYSVEPNHLHNVCLSLNFTDVPDGNHKLDVIANLHNGEQWSTEVSFSVVP